MAQITRDDAIRRIAKHIPSRLIGDECSRSLRHIFSVNLEPSLDDVIDAAPDLEDVENLICDPENIAFSIESDDEDGSWAGPWLVEIYDFFDVWLVRTIEIDDAWFSDLESAESHAYGLTHEKIIAEKESLSNYRSTIERD